MRAGYESHQKIIREYNKYYETVEMTSVETVRFDDWEIWPQVMKNKTLRQRSRKECRISSWTAQ